MTGQNLGKNFFCLSVGVGLRAGQFFQPVELFPTIGIEAVELGHGNEHGYITVIPLDTDRFALGHVKNYVKAPFGFSGGDGLHVSKISTLCN